MAVRIRKLAKQLGKPPTELLGVLHALGFSKYRSPEDMLSEVVTSKLRKGLAEGVRPLPVEVTGARKPKGGGLEALAEGGADVMSQLVPGVVRSGAPAPRPAPPKPAPRPPAPAARNTPVAAPAPEAPPADPTTQRLASAALESQRRALASERAAFEAERAQVEASRRRIEERERLVDSRVAALEDLEASLAAERRALAAERKTAGEGASEAMGSNLPSLMDLLEARGLRGADEFERAIVALARGRHLDDALWTLRVESANVLERVLTEQLILVSGQVPPQLSKGAAVVSVAPDRAEVPDAGALARSLDALGGALLLRGWRRVLVVGGRARWRRLLDDGLDERVTMRFVPSGPRAEEAVRADAAWADLIVRWAVDDDTPDYAAGGSNGLDVSQDAVVAFIEETSRFVAD